MPEYILPGADTPAFTALDDFTRGYIEALFFTSTEPGTVAKPEDDFSRIWCAETDSALPGDVGFEDLAPETLQRIIADCAEFQAAKSLLLEKAYECDGYSAQRAGHDYWLTRNHHGAGFWDRSELEGPDALGDLLTEAAHKRGEVDPYLGDDGQIYL